MNQVSLSFKTQPFEKLSIFWRKVFPLMKKHLRLDEEYMTSIKQERVKQSLEQIDSYFSDEGNSEKSYLITNSIDGSKTTQSFLYGEVRGDAKFTVKPDHYVTNYQEFANELVQVFEISNMLAHDSGSGYKRSLRPYFTPPNSDLYSGPGLINTHYRNFIEGVASEMWFGDSFWQYSSCTKEDVLACDWLECEQQSTALYVKAWPELFNSSEGEQGEVQRRLLKLLFNIDENRPHGMVDQPGEPSKAFTQKVFVDGKNIRKIGDLEERGD